MWGRHTQKNDRRGNAHENSAQETTRQVLESSYCLPDGNYRLALLLAQTRLS